MLSQRAERVKWRLCARCVFVVQRRASVVILTNGGYGDVFAMLAAGQLREMAARSSSLNESDPQKYPNPGSVYAIPGFCFDC